MAVVQFPYEGFEPASVPDSNLIGVFERAPTADAGDPAQIVRASLDQPFGPSLEELVQPGMRVLIIVDDVTRSTRADIILPVVLNALERRVNPAQISFLMALGTHRPMTAAEISAKVGSEVAASHEIKNHQWREPSALEAIAETDSGIEVLVNRALRQADMVLGIGHIAPHSVCGFGGGGKIILPGVTGQETTFRMHELARSLDVRNLRGSVDNAVRREIDKIGQIAGLRFVVNVVQDESDRIVACFSGHPVDAHRAGCSTSITVHGTPVHRQADIVIIDSHPADIDLWQGWKAIAAADLAVREGGVVILVTPCPDGVSPEHPVWLELGHLADENIQSMIDSGQIQDRVGAAAIIGVRRCTTRFKVILVSPGIGPDDKKRLGLIHADTPAKALDLAFGICGGSASVAVLRNGGEVLPIMEERLSE